MTTTPEPEHLSGRHRDTLAQIFAHPVSHNIEWHAVVSLLDAVGTTSTSHDGKLDVSVGDEKTFLDPPKGKDIDAQLVVGVQVVRRRQQRHDPREALPPQPEDLLVTPHFSVIAGVAAGTFADRQMPLDYPSEEPGRYALCPLTFHPAPPHVAGAAGRAARKAA